MQTPLDLAINDASKAEGTYTANTDNVGVIQAAIDSATSPLAPALAVQKDSAIAFNLTMDALSKASIDAKVPVAA